MWGINRFKNKSNNETNTDQRTSKYYEGRVVYQPGDYPRLPKLIYKVLTDGSILAAEFLITDDNIIFVKNVMLEEKQIAAANPDTNIEAYFSDNWDHYKKTGEFINDRRKYEFATIDANQGRFNVVCLLSNRESFTWYDQSAEATQQLYDSLRIAKLNKTIWESNGELAARQFIGGDHIVSVNIRPIPA